MKKISEHISYNEATRSATAKRFGIDNEPNEVELIKMKRLAEKVFEPLRKHVGGPIRVNSFFRSPLNEIWLLRFCQGHVIRCAAMTYTIDGQNKRSRVFITLII